MVVAVVSGWAALNTLREIEKWHRDGAEFCSQQEQAEKHERYADYLALVQAALEAAEHRLKAGPNDTCDNELNPDYDCSCGHAALAAALRAVREGAFADLDERAKGAA